MPITIKEITSEQVGRLLQSQEGHFLDFKDCRIAPAKLTETVSAFANADGGELYVGVSEVEDKFKWAGFATPEDSNGHLQIFETLFPLGQFFLYEFLTSNSHPGCVLYVHVLKNPNKIKASDSVLYLRRGPQNLPQKTPEAIHRLELNKGLASFESETVQVDAREICESDVIRKFISQVVPSAQPEEWLRKQQLIRGEKPTVAGVLLFADLPQAIVPKRCAVKIYRYKTSKESGTRETLADQPLTIEGNLYQQIYETVKVTKNLIEERHDIDINVGTQSYPHETLHEIITNALLHRDYSVADDVHVRIFDNRVEIESPGTLSGHVTEENIYNERFARNGNLVRIINKFPDPPNKDIGEGLRTARAAMARMRLKAPEIKQRPNSVLVFIRQESIVSNEAIVREYMQTHETVTNAKVREICHVDRNQARNILKQLQERNFLEKVPGTKMQDTVYRRASGERKPTAQESHMNVAVEREHQILDHLQHHGFITGRIITGRYQISRQGGQRICKRMEKKGLIERIPGRRPDNSVAYRTAIRTGS
jgi:ATP-dependent DNA helicase RecG